MKIPVTRLADCPDLLLSQINETLTNLADHCQRCSHEAIQRSLRDEQSTPRVLWDHVWTPVMSRARGYVVFDDPVLGKTCSHAMAVRRHPDSGHAKAVRPGRGGVTCGSVPAGRKPLWLSEYRRDDPDGDGTTPREPVREMWTPRVSHKPRPLQAVLLATWAAPTE